MIKIFFYLRNDSLFSNRHQYQNPLLGCKITHEFSIHIQNCQKTYENYYVRPEDLKFHFLMLFNTH